MAVSIDRVYQKVLAFANKEQRGYITPQEFNLFADQAQMEIFEQYFYDINQWTRQHGNDHEYSDMLTNLQEKIDLFNTYQSRTNVVNKWGDIYLDDIPNLYRIGRINVHYSGESNAVSVEYHTWEENMEYGNSPLTRWSKKRPMYNRFLSVDGTKLLKIRPYPEKPTIDNNGDYVYTDIVQIFYTRKPIVPSWNYIVVNDKALYNSTTSTDFELHLSEESELVYRILAYAGIAIEKSQLAQTGAGLISAQIQQEKQKINGIIRRYYASAILSRK